jgi:hypothetical protein
MSLKRKKIVIGDFLRLKIGENVFFYGRLVLQQTLLVYDFYQDTPNLNITVKELSKMKTLFYIPISDRVLKDGELDIISNLPLSEEDILKQPPLAWVDIGNPNNCILLYPNNEEVKATPEMCEGLEKVGSWSYINVIDRIKKHLEENQKNE